MKIVKILFLKKYLIERINNLFILYLIFFLFFINSMKILFMLIYDFYIR